MRKTILIILISLIQIPSFGYKIVQRQVMPHHHIWNIPNYKYNYPHYTSYGNFSPYRVSNPITKIKRYFVGSPTGYTITPQYNTNNLNSRGFFSDNGGDEYYYDNGGYTIRNRETTGGGSVTIIND